MKGSGNDRSLLRAKIAEVIKGLKVWESAEVEIQREEGMHQGRPRKSIRISSRFHGDSPSYCSGQSPAANAAKQEARKLSVLVKSDVMPKEGGKGLMLRITRVG